MNKKLTTIVALGLSFSSLDAAIREQVAVAKAEVEDLFLQDKKVFFIDAEFLYWTVGESATDFAIEMNHPAWSSTQSTYAVGHYKNATFGFDPAAESLSGISMLLTTGTCLVNTRSCMQREPIEQKLRLKRTAS